METLDETTYIMSSAIYKRSRRSAMFPEVMKPQIQNTLCKKMKIAPAPELNAALGPTLIFQFHITEPN